MIFEEGITKLFHFLTCFGGGHHHYLGKVTESFRLETMLLQGTGVFIWYTDVFQTIEDANAVV